MFSEKSIQELYDLADKSETIEELTGNASEVVKYANERSWLLAYWCYRAKELGGLAGIKEVCRILPITSGTGEIYSRVWKHYHHLKDKYPRLSFTYFATLYTLGIYGSVAITTLDLVDDNGLSIPQMRERLEKRVHRESCVCPVCKAKHTRKE